MFALHLFDQSMVGMMDKVSHELIEWIHAAKVQLIGKEMNANSVTYYLSGSSEPLNHIRYQAEKRYPQAKVSGRMVALISAIGAHMETTKCSPKDCKRYWNTSCNPWPHTRRCVM